MIFVQVDLTVVTSYDVFHDGQSKPCPIFFAVSHKWREQRLANALGNSGSRIDDPDLESVLQSNGLDAKDPAFLENAHGIVREVEQHAFHFFLVEARRTPVAQVSNELYLVLLHLVLEDHSHVPDEILDRDRLEIVVFLAARKI